MYKNKARCKLCGDLIESKYRHDFVSCSCGSLSLDGGLAYKRVLWRGGEYRDVVEEYFELVTPKDVTVTANISAKERDNEQEYYLNLYEALVKENENEDNGKRTQDGDGQREVPVCTSRKHGEEVGKEIETGGTSTSPKRKPRGQQAG